MDKPLRLVGYLEFKNLEFITAVPLFQIGGGENSGLFRQVAEGEKISAFRRVELSDQRLPPNFVPLDSGILRARGDPLVFLQANLGSEIVVSASAEDHRSAIGAKLTSEIGDTVDPVVGLELAEFVGDDLLVEVFFRRVARSAFRTSLEGARNWASRHRLGATKPKMVSDTLLMADLPLLGVEIARGKGNAFAMHGFAKSEMQYYCSSYVLDYLDLFEPNSVRDPILLYTRPISELPNRGADPFVVFVSADEFNKYRTDVDALARYVAQGLKLGGSLILLADIQPGKQRSDLNMGRELSNALATIADAVINFEPSRMDDGVCILFSESQLALKRAIRSRASADRLERMNALFSAQLSG